MPLLSTLERFIARVEHNKHVEAIEEFYTADATMQENNEPPRVGRDALIAHEQRAMARTASVSSTCVRPVFQHDEFVVIRWIFEFVGNDGSTAHIEELAYQRWEGEHIAQEQFFYDPKQFVAKTN
jgi:SnoaL-like domain